MNKDEILVSLEQDFIKDFIRIRKNHNLTQQSLADMSGTIREKISKIENSLNSPQLNSLIKILEPIGYTIRIVPIKKED